MTENGANGKGSITVLGRGEIPPPPDRIREHRDPAEDASLELDDADREAVVDRLADLPPVSDDEYYAPSTRIEVIDIAVEAIRARRMAAGEDADDALTPDDYDD